VVSSTGKPLLLVWSLDAAVSVQGCQPLLGMLATRDASHLEDVAGKIFELTHGEFPKGEMPE